MIMQGDDELIQQEFDFYMKGSPSLERVKKANPYSWLSETGWKDLMLLQTLGTKGGTLSLSVIAHEVSFLNTCPLSQVGLT